VRTKKKLNKMFSFFKSSKKSPVVSPVAEPAKSDEHAQRGGDDFVLIGSRGNNPMPLYPSAQLPAPSPHPHHFNRQYSLQIANYAQNVPFKLNPTLTSGNSEDLFEYKLREINQLMSSASQRQDYDFKLERSILDQN
jgi:hypothetical protein